MDTVLAATKAGEDGDQILHRVQESTPPNLQQLRAIRNEDYPPRSGWMDDCGLGEDSRCAGPRSQDDKALTKAIVAAYDRLAASADQSDAPNGATVRKVSVDALRDEVKSHGFLDTDAKGHVTASIRTKTYLITKGNFVEVDGSIWRP
jgi:hypothetical protein